VAPAPGPFHLHLYLRFDVSQPYFRHLPPWARRSILFLPVGLGLLGGGVRIMRYVTNVRGFVAICMAIAFAFLAFNFSVTGQGTATTNGVACKTLTGIPARAKLSGCNDAAGTGGAGHFGLKNPTTIKWANGDTTTISPFSATAVPKGKLCAPGDEEFTLSGTVSADTTGTIGVGGKVVGVECANLKTQKIVNAPGKNFKMH
jgi:hypothetical protein